MKLSELRELARLYSIQVTYEDAAGKRKKASRESLVAAIRRREPRLGAEKTATLIRERVLAIRSRVIEPVIVVWGSALPLIELRLPRDVDTLTYELELESGETEEGQLVVGAATWAEDGFVGKTATLPRSLPHGYHTLRVELDGTHHEALILAAPKTAHAPKEKAWGIFAPIYAMRTERTWGIGDLGDMEAYRAWGDRCGGGIVATLPMNGIYAEDDPSPYSPVSRLFWNEMYLDVRRLPEYRDDALAPIPIDGDVDYKATMRARRALLEQLATRFEPDDAYGAFEEKASAYARFRAEREERDSERYHLYVQYRMAQQMRELADKAREQGLGLYLDFPLGVNPNGYDAWRYADHFAQGVSVGAPPDAFFTKGQNWGFPPLDPDAIRERRYSYFRECVRMQLEHAGVLRIDHVMGLHRLFWIPQDHEAKDGVYVRYAEEELYAILLLESSRHRSVIVGEDLGTVPAYVPRMMGAHGIRRMYVIQYEAKPDDENPVPAPPAKSVASINTHDMPTFAGFWRGKDIDDRLEQELLDEKGARDEHEKRAAMRESFTQFLKARGLLREEASDTVAILEAVLRFLAGSDAEIVLVNLEDLWLDEEPQNVPGLPERSWRHRMKLGLEQAEEDATVARILRAVDNMRRQGHGDTT